MVLKEEKKYGLNLVEKIQLLRKQKSRTHIKDTDQSNSMVCSTLASRYETLFLKNKYRII